MPASKPQFSQSRWLESAVISSVDRKLEEPEGDGELFPGLTVSGRNKPPEFENREKWWSRTNGWYADYRAD
jgi:hypothetical protein